MSPPAATETRSSAAEVALPDAPPAAVPTDLREFVRRERLARPVGWRSALHIIVVLGTWVGLAAIGFAVDSTPGWIVVWALMALCTATPIALMHEAVHQNLFRSRFANHLTGVVAAAWVFFHGPAYRAWHLTHHAYTFSDDDSEQLPERFRSKLGYLGYCLVLGPSFAAILWAGAAATVVGRPPRWIGAQRLRSYVRRWAVVPLVVVALAVLAAVAWPEVVVRAWLIPAALGSLFVFPFLTMPEHYEGKGRDELLDNTRTTSSNRVMSYLYWNNNLHTAHHLVPTIPPHKLGHLDAYISERNTLRDRGFFAFHARVLRELPWLPGRDAVEPVPAIPTPEPEVVVDLVAAEAAPATTPARGPRAVTVTIGNRIDPVHLPRLWDIYRRAFEPLRELALLNHLYPRDLFEELLLDDRVFKIIGWRDGEPIGIAAATNHLELVPQISPPFLHKRYPEHAKRDAIYFGIFVCVDADARVNSLTGRLIAGMGQVAAVRGGVIISDVSQHNVDIGVDRMVGRVTSWFPDNEFNRIDSQHYYESVLPIPLDRLPFSNAPMPEIEYVIDLRDQASSPDQSVPTAER